jgi:predicted lactoylglutathione lyase
MPRQIFVNLAVKDLKKSMDFFTKVGFRNNPQFTDDTAACMVVSETIYVMLLTEPKFKSFSPRPLSDAKKATEVLIALSYDSRAQVDEVVRSAVAAGGATYSEPKDHGFMYQHGFEDPDGHVFEVFWMDPGAIPSLG